MTTNATVEFESSTTRKTPEVRCHGKDDPYPVEMGPVHNRAARLPLTYRCNLRCRYCFWSKHRDEMPVIPPDMDFDLACRVIDRLVGHIRSLVLYDGGEPLLYQRLEDLIRYARRYVQHITTTTNGVLLTEEKSSQLSEAGLSDLTISIDGASAEHNKITRGIPLERILKNTELFSRISGKPVTLAAVVTMDNIDTIEPMLEWRTRIPTFRTLSLNTVGGTKEHLQGMNGLISSTASESFLMRLRQRCTDAGIKLLLNCFNDESMRNIWGTPCRMPWSGLISISMKGDLMPCSRIHHIPLANILSDGLEGALNAEKTKRFRAEIREGNYSAICCKTCRYSPGCGSFLDDEIEERNYI